MRKRNTRFNRRQSNLFIREGIIDHEIDVEANSFVDWFFELDDDYYDYPNTIHPVIRTDLTESLRSLEV